MPRVSYCRREMGRVPFRTSPGAMRSLKMEVRTTVSWAAASSGVQALETLSASRGAGIIRLGAGVRVTSEEKSLDQTPSLRPGVRVRIRVAYPQPI